MTTAGDVPKVIYAPNKAFKEIVKNPKYLGVLIVFVIFVGVQVSASYVIATKSYLEQTKPTGTEGDLWTDNAGLWQANSGIIVSNNTDDYINSSSLYLGAPIYFGTQSVEFTSSNASVLRMELTSIGIDEQVSPESEGFKNMSFRLKIVNPGSQPNNVVLVLDSLNASSFSYDLTSEFSTGTLGFWSNITVPIGSGSWSTNGSGATWENITGLKMELDWASSSNIDVRLDGLFFRGEYLTPIEFSGAGSYLATSAVNGITPFVFEWIILTGALFIMIKVLKGNVKWRPIMVAVGFALIVLVVQSAVILLVYTSLPTLYYPLELLANVPGESSVAPATTLAAIDSTNFIGSIVQIVMWLWLAGLGAIITREVTGLEADVPPFGWVKSIAVSGLSLLVTILIVGLLG